MSFFRTKKKNSQWRDLKYLWVFAIIVTLPFTKGCGCGSDEDIAAIAALSDTALTEAQIASVDGTVSTSIVTSSISTSTVASMVRSSDTAIAEGCSCEVYGVGLGKLSGSGGCSVAGTTFSAKINKDHEAILKFSCTNREMRCFGKGNDNDLICDPLADAMVSALEESLSSVIGEGNTVENTTLFRGLSVAKMVQGMIEILKLTVALDPTSDLFDKIEAAEGNKATLMSIISENAVIGATFKALEEMAKKIAENNKIGIVTPPGETVPMSVEAIVNLMVGMGLQIYTAVPGPDGQGDGIDLYSTLFTSIDKLLNVTAIADFRTYLSALYDDIYKNKKASAVAMVCIARNEQNWDQKPIIYNPVKDETTGYLSCDDTNIIGLSIDWQTETDGVTSGSYRYEGLVLRPASIETDRNDPTGKYGDKNNFSDFGMGFVDVFEKPFFSTIDDYATTNNVDCGFNESAGPGEDFIANETAFSDCMDKSDAGKYFAGVLGIYRFMNDTTLSSTKFSLDDIYNAFSKSIVIRAESWGGGFNGTEIEVSYTEDNETRTDRAWVPSMLIEDPDNPGAFQQICPPELKTLDPNIDLCVQAGSTDVQMTDTVFKAMMANYKPGYDSTMMMFEKIPTMDEIKRSIFQDAHHVDWNIVGSKFFWLSGFEEPDKTQGPIMCKINNPNAGGDFVNKQSTISCQKATDGTWGEDGKESSTIYGKGWFGLQERSSPEADDRYFALINLGTGFEYNLNGRQFRIQDVTGGTSDTLKSVYDEQFCNTWTDQEGKTKTDCWKESFDFVELDMETLYNNDFRPYNWNITIVDQTDNSEKWIDVIVSQSGTSWSSTVTDPWKDDFPVCVTSSGVSVTGTTVDTVTLSNATLDNCWNLQSEEGTDYYYLELQYGSGTGVAADFTLRLVKNDGTFMDGTDAYVTVDAVDTALSGATINVSYWDPDTNQEITDPVTQTGPNLVYETGSHKWMPGYEYANPNHNGKFDPFCDDTDENKECNCKDAAGNDKASGCTLENPAGSEPTFSDPPYWIGDPNAVKVQNFIETCGNQSGATLVKCVDDKGFQQGGGVNDMNTVGADWQKLFACTTAGNTMSWIEEWKLWNTTEPDRVNIGGDCGGKGINGEVRVRKILARKNAYDVARPKTLMSLMAAATQTIGTGVDLARTDEKLALTEAMALLLARLSIPVKGTVTDANGTPLDFVNISYDKVHIPGEHTDPIMELLRIALGVEDTQ